MRYRLFCVQSDTLLVVALAGLLLSLVAQAHARTSRPAFLLAPSTRTTTTRRHSLQLKVPPLSARRDEKRPNGNTFQPETAGDWGKDHPKTLLSRRAAAINVAAAAVAAPFAVVPSVALATLSSTTTSPSPISSSTTKSISYIDPSEAQITNRVFLKVRVSRQDGTFYVRDDLPDTPENRVFQGQLVVGLFGKVAPVAVGRFLSYVDTESDPLNDNPLPSYGRSYFPSLDPRTGLLMGGTIPSLQITEVSGSVALQYGGRLLPATLWVEPSDLLQRVTHTRKGLLTHRILDATPAFGITTRSDTRELDRSHTAFGTLLPGDGDNQAFLDIVRDLPTYSMERPASSTLDLASDNYNVVDDAAGAIFNAQRNFFRTAAKTLGDTRLDKVYEGKILRRIEVTQVGRL